jgi:hypothetical protein
MTINSMQSHHIFGKRAAVKHRLAGRVLPMIAGADRGTQARLAGGMVPTESFESADADAAGNEEAMNRRWEVR